MSKTGSLRDYMADIAQSNVRSGGSGGNSSDDDTQYEIIECTIGTEENPASNYIDGYSDDNFEISSQNSNDGYKIRIVFHQLQDGAIEFAFSTNDSGTIFTTITWLNTTQCNIDTTNIQFGGDPTILELDAWGDIIAICNEYKIILHCYIDVYRGSQE